MHIRTASLADAAALAAVEAACFPPAEATTQTTSGSWRRTTARW